MSRSATRQKIINDAAILFDKKGYQNIGIPEIEKVTGRTKAVLYGYFENKQALANAVLMHNLAQKRNRLSQQIAIQTTYLGKLSVYFELHDPERKLLAACYAQIFNAGNDTDPGQQEMHQILANDLSVWKQDVVALLTSGIQAGEFKCRLTVDDLALQMISLIQGALVVSNTTQRPKLGQGLLEQAKKSFISQLNTHQS